MTGQVTALVALAGAVLLLGLLVSLALGRRKRSASTSVVARKPAPRAQRGALPSAPVPRGVARARPPGALRRSRLAVAEPGDRGPLFQYGGDGAGFEVDAPYAVVAIATTGFSPANGDRIVEIAIARVDDAGRVSDEYSTLLDPGRDVGPVFVHGISTSEVRGRPDVRRHRRRDPRPARRRRRRAARRRVRRAVPRRRVRPRRRRSCRSPRPSARSGWPAGRCAPPDHTLRTLSRHAGAHRPRHVVRPGRRPHPGRPAAADARRLRASAALPLRPAPDAGTRRRRSTR